MSTENPFIEHPATFAAHLDGEQWEFKFRNGFGASVVRNRYSYGGSSGLWELAVVDSANNLTYSTPITDNVLGWLSDESVRETLRKIAELPATAEVAS